MKLRINNKLFPRCVLIYPMSVTNWIYEAIIPILRKKYNTKFIIIAAKSREKYIKENWLSSRDKIILYESIEEIKNSKNLDINIASEKIAQENEKQFNINYMQDIIQLERTWSTFFLSCAPMSVLNWMGTPRLEKMTKMINHFIKFSKNLIKKEKIDLALLWPVDAFTASFTAVAKKSGLEISYPYISGRKGLMFWSASEYLGDALHKYMYEQIGKREPIPFSDIVPVSSVDTKINKLDEIHSFKKILISICRKTFHRIEFAYIDLKKMDFRSKNRTPFFQDMLLELYRWIFYKKIGKISEKNIKNFKKPFIYFSLAIEPEFSVQIRSKEFNNQSAIIRQIAMSLPFGCELVIKEHVLFRGRRIEFYEELLKFPNIKMAHPSIRGIDLAEKSLAVASLSGSISLEATLLGKPVIEFSKHSTYSFLPNVFTIKNLHDLPSLLKYILKLQTKSYIKKTRLIGAKLLSAIEKISFSGEGSPIFGKSSLQINKEDFKIMSDLLIQIYQLKKAGLVEQYQTFK